MSVVFPTPLDGILSALSAPHVAGDGRLVLADAARLAGTSPAAPVRLSVFSPDRQTVYGQFLATGIVGNALTVAPDRGTVDAPCPAGSLVACSVTANVLADIYAAIGAILAAPAGGAVTSVAGRTGAVVLSVADVAGLGSIATRAAADYLTPTGSGAGLTALNASALATGTVATARLGSGSASSATFLRGDGQWAAPAGGAVASVAGRTGAVVLSTADVAGLGSAAALDASAVLSPTGSGAGLTALNASALATGTVATARLGSGSASSATFLRGDGQWATPAGGSGTVLVPGSNGQMLYVLNGQLTASTMVTDGGSVIQFNSGDIAYVQNTGKSLKLSQTGDQYGATSLELMNRVGVNGARFTSSIWLVDFVFLAASTGIQSNIRLNTDSTILPANATAGGGEFVFYMNTGGSNPLFAARFGAGASQIYSPTTFQAQANRADDLVTFADSSGNPLSGVSAGGFIRSVVGNGPPAAAAPDGSDYTDNLNGNYYRRIKGQWRNFGGGN